MKSLWFVVLLAVCALTSVARADCYRPWVPQVYRPAPTYRIAPLTVYRLGGGHAWSGNRGGNGGVHVNIHEHDGGGGHHGHGGDGGGHHGH